MGTWKSLMTYLIYLIVSIKSILLLHHTYCSPFQGMEKDYNLRTFALLVIITPLFFACSNRPQAINFVNWWLHETVSVDEINFSLCRFREQGWLRFAADFVDRVWINREPGLNFAYWRYNGSNLQHDGNFWKVDGQRLKIFHYSGLDFNNLSQISRWQNRYSADFQMIQFLTQYKDRFINENQLTNNC